MALLTSSPQKPLLKTNCKQKASSKRHIQPSSWDQIKNLLGCKYLQSATAVHNPPTTNVKAISGAYSKLGHCKYTCSFKDVVQGNTKVIHRANNSPGNRGQASMDGKLLLGFRCHRHRDPCLVMLQGDVIPSPRLREKCNLGNFLVVVNVI